MPHDTTKPTVGSANGVDPRMMHLSPAFCEYLMNLAILNVSTFLRAARIFFRGPSSAGVVCLSQIKVNGVFERHIGFYSLEELRRNPGASQAPPALVRAVELVCEIAGKDDRLVMIVAGGDQTVDYATRQNSRVDIIQAGDDMRLTRLLEGHPTFPRLQQAAQKLNSNIPLQPAPPSQRPVI